ncbi:MAG: PLP-dependent aminotransferase family protein [Gaiellales bacterium]
MVSHTNPDQEGFPADLLLEPGRPGGRVRARVEQGIRRAIQEGRLPGGATLPPTRVLAAELGISRSAVVAAYGNLVDAGYLEARQGSGTRVRTEAAGTPSSPVPEGSIPAEPVRVVIDLNGGQPAPDLFPRMQWLRHYRAALAETPDRELDYPALGGAARLRRALHGYLGRVRGVATTPERLVVVSGVTQGVTLACRALRRAGARRVAVEDPCFAAHRIAIGIAGLEAVPVAVDGGGPSLAELERAGADALLVAPAHSYPLGAVVGDERRRALITWARRHGTVILEDDYDAEFRYDRVPVGALQGLAPDSVVYLGSASKTVNPALRLGWLAAPPELANVIALEKKYDDMGQSLLDQHAFARFVESGDFTRYLRRVRPIYRAKRAAAIAAARRHLPHCSIQGADAGLHFHLTLPPAIDEEGLVNRLADRGVRLDPAARHWADPADAPPSIILGFGASSEQQTRRGIELLAEEVARPGS